MTAQDSESVLERTVMAKGRRLKIVYIHQYFNKPSDSGSTRSYEIAKRFVAGGHEVHMVTSDRSQTSVATRTEEFEGIKIHWLPVAYSNNMTFGRRILAFFDFAFRASGRARGLKGDVVYASSTPLTVAIPGMFATIARPGRLVLEVRDLWPEVPIALNAIRNPLVKFAARSLEWLAYHRSERVIALSEGMKDGVVRRGYPADRIHVVPNGSDIDVFDGHEVEAQEWRESLEWLGTRPLVVHCGTMGFVNGVEYLADLAAAVYAVAPDVRFVTVGAGNRMESVRARADELGVLGLNFFMLPPVRKSVVPVIFRASTVTTCLVAPIRELENNSANKVFDSFAAGKPVAINYGGWQRALLEDSGAGIYLDAENCEVAASQLVALIQDDEKLDEAARAARRLAEDTFARDKLTDALVDVLENLMEAERLS